MANYYQDKDTQGAGFPRTFQPSNPYRPGGFCMRDCNTRNPFRDANAIPIPVFPDPRVDHRFILKPDKVLLNTGLELNRNTACETWIELKQRFAAKAHELRNSIIIFENNARTLPTSSVAISICRSVQADMLPHLLLINRIVLCELRHAQSVGKALDLSKTDFPAEDITWHYRKFYNALNRLNMSLEDMSMEHSYEPVNSRTCESTPSAQSEGRLFETFSPFRNRLLQDSILRMDGIVTTLRSARLRKGLEKVRYNQEYNRNNFMNIATIATFLSSVTATTLQYSYSQTSAGPSEELWAYVNGLWFSSLVFSIASGANSFLGVGLYQRPEYFGHSSLSEYRYIRYWFDKCPMLFLVISGGLFGIGLCLFSVASNQSHYTRVITISLTATHIFFIAAIFSMASIRLLRLLMPTIFHAFCPSWSEEV